MERRIQRTLGRAQFLARHLHSDPPAVVVAVLIDLDIPTHLDGFEYLKRAILLFYEKPTSAFRKEIYTTVGAGCSVEPGAIEQAIRVAIVKAWKRRQEGIWEDYFPTDRSGKLSRPSNSEFISTIARFLELWEGCCKEVRYEKV